MRLLQILNSRSLKSRISIKSSSKWIIKFKHKVSRFNTLHTRLGSNRLLYNKKKFKFTNLDKSSWNFNSNSYNLLKKVKKMNQTRAKLSSSRSQAWFKMKASETLFIPSFKKDWVRSSTLKCCFVRDETDSLIKNSINYAITRDLYWYYSRLRKT